MDDKEVLIDNIINSLLATAMGEVGYKECANNKNKYAAVLDAVDYYAPQKKQNVAWCSIFVTWCFFTEFKIDLCRKILYQPVKNNYSASCKFQYEYYKKNKATSKIPKKGYQIFFGKDCTHTGLVYKVDSKKVYTIEGNKGDQVKKCSYSIDSSRIFGYGIPDYAADIRIVDTKPEEPKERYYLTTAKSGLNIRYEANLKSPVVGLLKYNTKVKGKVVGDFIQISKHQYIYKKYTIPYFDKEY